MKLSKSYKAEHYDEVATDRDKYMLALYDLANGKFSKPVILEENTYIPTGSRKSDSKLSIRLSWRAMPLFLMEWRNGPVVTSQRVFTESELEDISRDAHSTGNIMLRDAFFQCKREYYPKAA